MDHHLDTLGKVCPLPILMTAKAMLDLRAGDHLTVVGDDPAMLDDMPVFCYRSGYRLVTMNEAEDGTIRCEIEKH